MWRQQPGQDQAGKAQSMKHALFVLCLAVLAFATMVAVAPFTF